MKSILAINQSSRALRQAAVFVYIIHASTKGDAMKPTSGGEEIW